MGRRNRPLLAMTFLVAWLVGCAGYRDYHHAQIAETQGNWDEAVLHYMKVVQANPDNIAYRSALLRAKIRASQEHFEKGKDFQAVGVLERAATEYQQAVALDATNQYAQVELTKVREQLAAAREERDPVFSLDDLKRQSKEARSQPPSLNPRSDEPISLNFPEPVSIKDIYRALGKSFGINIMFDSALRDQQVTVELEEVTAQTALEHLMRSGKHFYKVIDEHSIVVAEDTAQNRRVYEDHVIQAFFLSNADTKEVMTMLRTLVGAKNIAPNDELNAVILRDTIDKVKVAERIIQAIDKSRAEVVVDVELLQINTIKLRELGVSLSAYQVTQSLDLGGADVPLRLSDLEFLNQSNWSLSIPSFIYDFVKNSSDAQLLARPQVRISDGEKANLHIGERVPIPVTTFNTAQTIGSNIVPITSFQYQDVGIRIEIEPRIHHNHEVTLKLKVEVSNLSGFVEGSGGQSQPIIGTRTIESTIRLQDGETSFLAGLIRSDETNTESGVPGLSDIPVLGRLFSRNSNNNQRTDVVLTMTPHIVRTSDITADDLRPIWVGTEANITFRGGSPRVESDTSGPFDDDEESTERIREMLRRRIQNLPRGLRGTGEDPEGGEEPSAEAPGVQLSDPGLPSNIFEEPQNESEDEDEGDPNAEFRLLFPYHPAQPGVAQVASLAAGPTEVGGSKVRLRLTPEVVRVSPGEVFDVAVRVETDTPVSHLPITLRFDPQVLQVKKILAGKFLGEESEAVFLSDHSDQTRPGRIVLGASRVGEVPGVQGTGVIARIRFEAVASGSTTVEFKRKKALDEDLRSVGPVSARSMRVISGDGLTPGRRFPEERRREVLSEPDDR